MTGRVASLDGLRGVAILLVVLAHSSIPVIRFGGIVGVTLFFVLSGYLITSILLREHEKTGKIHIGRFYARRALRLMPALVVAVVGGAGLAILVARDDASRVAEASASSLLYINNLAPVTGMATAPFGQYWSLAMEEQYYLLWPALLLLLLTRVRAFVLPLLGLLVVLSLVARFSGDFLSVAGFRFSYAMPHTNAWALLAGSGLAFVLARKRTAPSWCAPVGIAGLLLTATVLGLVTGLREDPSELARGLRLISGPVAAVFALLLVIAAATQPVGWLLNPVLLYFGRISYALYLWHGLLEHAVGVHLGSSGVRGMAVGLVTLVVAIGVAEVSWRYVETPFLRRKARLERRWATEGSAVSAFAAPRDTATPAASQ